MPHGESLKSRLMDQKDKEILMLLQENGRETLTTIAKKIHLSIDSVNNRMQALMKKGVFFPGIFIDPHVIGFDFIVDVRIKLQNPSIPDKERFLNFLVEHPRIINVLSITGTFDILCTTISRNANEFDTVCTEIRNKFRDSILDWQTEVVLKTHKLEMYNLLA